MYKDTEEKSLSEENVKPDQPLDLRHIRYQNH